MNKIILGTGDAKHEFWTIFPFVVFENGIIEITKDSLETSDFKVNENGEPFKKI